MREEEPWNGVMVEVLFHINMKEDRYEMNFLSL